MRVVFLQDVPRVALAGEVKEVADGFARNYLIPKRLAVPATPDQLQRIGAIRRAAEERRRRELADLQSLVEALNGRTVVIKARSSEGGRLYGSVTALSIAGALSEQVGREVDRRAVDLPEPIKALGTYTVRLRFPQNLEAQVTVVVEDPARPAPSGEAEGEASPSEGGEGQA